MRRQGMGRNQLGEEVGAGGGGAGRPTGAGLPVRLLWLLRLAGLLLRPGLARFGAAVRAELRGVANAARADARRERARRRGPSNGSPRPTSSSSHCTFFPALSYRPQETFLGSGPRPRDRRVRPPEELPRGYRREWPRRRPSRGETPWHFFPTVPPPPTPAPDVAPATRHAACDPAWRHGDVDGGRRRGRRSNSWRRRISDSVDGDHGRCRDRLYGEV